MIRWLKCVGSATDTDTDIVIKPADKGSGTVVMNRQNYLDECYRQLHDQSFYKRVNEDRAEDINKRVRFYLKRLLANKIIDKQTHRYLTPENAKAGRFYILPKIHNLETLGHDTHSTRASTNTQYLKQERKGGLSDAQRRNARTEWNEPPK